MPRHKRYRKDSPVVIPAWMVDTFKSEYDEYYELDYLNAMDEVKSIVDKANRGDILTVSNTSILFNVDINILGAEAIKEQQKEDEKELERRRKKRAKEQEKKVKNILKQLSEDDLQEFINRIQRLANE